MSITTVLFDLDGTLLPMDQELFVKAYFGGIAKHLAPYGYEPQKLIQTIWGGTAAMVKNDGSMTNEEAFWRFFSDVYSPEQAKRDYPHFETFYRDHFDDVQKSCGFAPEAREVIDLLKDAGKTLVLATNPLFPSIATEKRMAWAGLFPSDFLCYTTYENSKHCKPNLAYYTDILQAIGCSPEECLMVGNDVGEDMIARELGMQVFLLTPCLINKSEADLDVYPRGNFSNLIVYLEKNVL